MKHALGYLARNWPSPNPGKLRAVLMFTDGIIRNNAQPQSGDQVDPNVLAAAAELEIASITPYPFFWQDPIVPDPNRSEGGELEGQENFSEMDAKTGGAGLFTAIPSFFNSAALFRESAIRYRSGFVSAGRAGGPTILNAAPRIHIRSVPTECLNDTLNGTHRKGWLETHLFAPARTPNQYKLLIMNEYWGARRFSEARGSA
jgi:hypothetical protein